MFKKNWVGASPLTPCSDEEWQIAPGNCCFVGNAGDSLGRPINLSYSCRKELC